MTQREVRGRRIFVLCYSQVELGIIVFLEILNSSTAYALYRNQTPYSYQTFYFEPQFLLFVVVRVLNIDHATNKKHYESANLHRA